MPQLTITAQDWTQHAADLLAAAVPNCSILDIKQQIDDEHAQLFRVDKGFQFIGYYVLRIDYLTEHNEGVIIAAVGKDSSIDLTLEIIPAIEKQFIGCKFLRIHTARPGLVKKLNAIGFNPLEFVMIKGLVNG